MSATNGSLRSRSRLVGLAVVVVLALGAVFASTASAVFKPSQTDMALGDSLAFGYSTQTFNQSLPLGAPATAFEKGYANAYMVKQMFKLNKIQLDNLGCPGETTDSLIGNGPLGSVVDPVTGEAPCAYHNKLGFPLHHEYGENVFHLPQSQLESALEQLVVNDLSGTPVTTVTLNIGANDELHALAACEAEVKTELEKTGFSKYGGKENSEKGLIEKAEAEEDGAAAFAKGADAKAKGADAAAKGADAKAKGESAFAHKVKAEEDAAKAKEAAEHGEFEAAAKFQAEAEAEAALAASEGAAAEKEGAEAAAEGAAAEKEGAEAVAEGKEAEEDGAAAKAFFEAAGKEAGKACVEFHAEGLFKHIAGNIGTILFVLRNAEKFTGVPGTNYTGKIVFQGGYDPFGRVYKTKAEVEAALALPQFAKSSSPPKLGELLPGTNALAAILNSVERKLVTDKAPEAEEEGHEPFNACFAGVQGGAVGHPITAFNPGLGKEEGPKGSLQKYTNMNNQTSTTYGEPLEKILGGPRPNGPDIHPTEAGYKNLAAIMFDECGA